MTKLQDDRLMDDAAEAAHTVVLLVEDEPLVRMCAADILEDEGLEVIEVATAASRPQDS